MIVSFLLLMIINYFIHEKIANFFESLYLLLKKKRFIKLFHKEINHLIKEYKNKETKLIFIFENKNRTKLFYKKLIIFGHTYLIDPNKNLRIKSNYNNLIKSDFIEKVTLTNDTISKSFLIGINLRQENYYQIFIDISSENTNSTEIVYYSKNNNVPNKLRAGFNIIKNYESNYIPKIKRFCIININVVDVK